MHHKSRRVRTRFWWECGVAALSAVLLVLTAVQPAWLEALGFDPDHGDGSFEWIVVAVLVATFLVLVLTARWEWRRSAVI